MSKALSRLRAQRHISQWTRLIDRVVDIPVVQQRFSPTVRVPVLCGMARVVEILEHEMPGLMACREELGHSRPFKSLKTNGFLQRYGALPDPENTNNPEPNCVLPLDKLSYLRDAHVKKHREGVSHV